MLLLKTQSPDPASYVERLKLAMRKLQAVPPHQQQRRSYVSPDLTSCTHVFVRYDAVRKPLQRPYNGPYKVLHRDKKHFTVLVNGRNEVISLDRLKPARLDIAPTNDKDSGQSSFIPDVPAPSTPVRVSRSGRHIRWPDKLNL